MMDAFSDPKVERIVCMTSSQIGKTELLNNICGYFLHHDPGPILVLQPTLEMARDWSTSRLAPMIQSTPALRKLIGDPKSRDGDNTILLKTFRNGARLAIAGSNSPASLASRPIRVLLMDEIDRMPLSAGSEGDPVAISIRRTQNFFNRKVALVSTPTVAGQSRIEAAFNESDKRFWEVPCGKCGAFQRLIWKQVKWTDSQDSAIYECEKCSAEWTELERQQQIKKGKWIASEEFTGTAGFALNALCSPWTSMSGLARDFLEAKHHGTESLKVFLNTALGESWREDSVEISEHDLFSRIEKYEAEIPNEEIVVLTAAVDCQLDRLECLVVGHSHLDECYLLRHEFFYGSIMGDQVWEELGAFLQRSWEHPSGQDLRIVRTFIDSGYEPQRIYRFCQAMQAFGVWASKGVGGADRPVVGRPSKNNPSRCNVFPLGVNTIKTMLFTRLKNTEPGPGFIHIGDWADDEFIRQLTSERAVVRYSKGIPHQEFKKTRERNEALDLMVYNLGAFATLRADTRKVQKKLSEVRKDEKPKQPRRRRNWVSKW